MSADFDIAVVGSGFAGSLIAMIAKKLGRSVVLLERGQHPRFAIGESSTPLANLLLGELAQRYDLPRLLPLTKWGTWQESYPKIGCGLKRGFTFYHHQLDKPFELDPIRNNQLLVAASPNNLMADTHWYRSDFDGFLVSEAQAAGVEYIDQVALQGIGWTGSGVRIQGERQGVKVSVDARFLIDASGPRGFVHRALGLPEIPFEHLAATQGLFSHFTGVRRLADMDIFRGGEIPPYPVDDAAVHHVFEGGWVWVLRFNNGITSAGIAAREDLANELRFSEGDLAWQRLLTRLPTVREQFRDSRVRFPFIHASPLGFRSGAVTGRDWALLPSAAGFIDPLLSTGFPLTLLGVSRLAHAIERHWEGEKFQDRLREYSFQTVEELRVAEQLTAALYASMGDFPVFTGLTLLYFAAVSFTETARRLGKPELAPSFLMHDHPLFGRELRGACQHVLEASKRQGMTRSEKVAFLDKIRDVIKPIDVAGLCERSRRNWYPADARDLLQSAPKFGVDATEMKLLLSRCGFV